MSKLSFMLASNFVDKSYETNDLNLLLVYQECLPVVDHAAGGSEYVQCLYCHRQDAACLWGNWLQDRLRWVTDVFFLPLSCRRYPFKKSIYSNRQCKWFLVPYILIKCPYLYQITITITLAMSRKMEAYHCCFPCQRSFPSGEC